MRRMLSWISFAVTAFAVVVVAVSNRHSVPFYFWPGGQGVEMRLFALVLFTTFAAYLLGRAAGLWRLRILKNQLRQIEQTLRLAERDKLALQQERDALKASAATGSAAGANALPTTALTSVASREVA
jgi:uncharacterized integral membrane protein